MRSVMDIRGRRCGLGEDRCLRHRAQTGWRQLGTTTAKTQRISEREYQKELSYGDPIKNVHSPSS